MGIAFAAVGSGVASVLSLAATPFQALVAFFAPWQPRGNLQANPAAIDSVAANARPTKTSSHLRIAGQVRMQAGRPLRVLRVLDAGSPRHIAGRMVISGRMADVCAELDRLAQQDGC